MYLVLAHTISQDRELITYVKDSFNSRQLAEDYIKICEKDDEVALYSILRNRTKK